MKILWDKKLIKLSNGNYIAWGFKRKKFFFANKNELKLNCAIIEYYEELERCGEKVMSDYRKIVVERKEQLTKAIDILKSILDSFVGDLPRNLGYFDEEELKAIAEAEEFLKENEK